MGSVTAGARLGRAAEVTARRPADDNFRVRADQRVRGVAVLEALDEAGAALAPDSLAVVDVLALVDIQHVMVAADRSGHGRRGQVRSRSPRTGRTGHFIDNEDKSGYSRCGQIRL